jgi:O-antigen/teichoic acid export membrane protein
MSSLRTRAGKALAWDLFGNYGGQILSFVISIFLARLLGPEEFGLVGMSMVFIVVLRIFVDMGFASALIQNQNNTSLTYSSIFFLNIFAGFILSICIFLVAPFIGKFYGNDTVTTLVRLFSITFVVNSFNIVQTTILKKNLDFKKLTIRDIISQTAAGIAAVIFAMKGFGVYALVIQQILAGFIKTFLLWKVTEWYPRWEFSMAEVRKLTGFSAYVFAAQSLNQLIQQADALIIGKLFSPSTLGYFSRANSINTLITSNSVRSLNKVFFPVLSSVQNDDERFKAIYLKVISVVAGVAIFLTGAFFLCGEELIIGLFGKKWEPSVVIFEIIIIKGFTYPISAMIVNAFLAKGKSKENFKYGNIRKVLQLMPFVFAYLYGFQAYLYAVVSFSLINWLLNNYFITRSLGVGYLEQLKAVLPQLVIAVAAVGVIVLAFPDGRNFFLAAVKVIIFTSLYGLYLYGTKAVLWQELSFYRNKVWQRLKI